MSCVWTSTPAWAPKSHTAGGGNKERQAVRHYTWLRIIRDAPLALAQFTLSICTIVLFTVTLSLSCLIESVCAEPLAIHLGANINRLGAARLTKESHAAPSAPHLEPEVPLLPVQPSVCVGRTHAVGGTKHQNIALQFKNGQNL